VPRTASSPASAISTTLAPRVQLHAVEARHDPLATCRVVLHLPLVKETGALPVLAGVLQVATERAPSRQALAEHLDMLYGASLDASVEKIGDHQALVVSLSWPARLGRSDRPLAEGLRLLRSVLTRPLREEGASPDGGPRALRHAIVSQETKNAERALQGLRADRAAYAARALVGGVCRREPYGLDVRGSVQGLQAIDARALAQLHGEIVAQAPVDIWFRGPVTPTRVQELVARDLMWAPRARRPARMPTTVGLASAPARPYRGSLVEDVQQTRLTYAWRGRIGPRHRTFAAAHVLAGWLGGGVSSVLWHVLREEAGLCYDVDAGWRPAKGLLVVQTGVAPAQERRARSRLTQLVRRVLEGDVPQATREAWLAEHVDRLRAIGDHRGAHLAWLRRAHVLGLNPDVPAWIDALAAVTPREVRAAGRKLGLAGVQRLGPEDGSTRRRGGAP